MGIRPPEFGTKQLLTALGASILYASISLLFEPTRSEFVRGSIFVVFKPAIFFPGVVAILYGPLVGAIAAGIGTLLFDVTSNSIFRPVEPLRFYHLVNFVAHLVGGYFAGLLAKPAKDASTLFDVEPDQINTVGDYFNLAYLRRLFRNTMAAVVGLAFITGLIIGYGQTVEPVIYPAVRSGGFSAFDQFLAIAYSHGAILLFSIPLVIMIYSVVDYELDHRASIRLAERRQLAIAVPDDADFDILSVSSPEGDELWNVSWGAIRVVVKNTSSSERTFRFRVSANDLFSPHRDFTPVLQPGDTDEIYFNVYGITPGKKTAYVYVKSEQPGNESRLALHYQMGSSSEILVNKLVGLFLVIGLVISALLVVINLGEQVDLTTELILAFLALPVEIIVILTLYWVWNLKVTDSLLKTFHLREDESDDMSLLLDTPEERDLETRRDRIDQLQLRSRIFLGIASFLFIIVTTIIITNIVDVNLVGPEVLITLVIVLALVLLASDIMIERADRLSSTVLTETQLKNKVIRSAVAESRPEKFETALVVLRVHNPFDTMGMRILLHSIDNISPREIILRDIKPNEMRAVGVQYTPLDRGKREIAFEFVQFRDDENQVIPRTHAKTFDQEALKIKVSGTRVLGLSTSQIRMVRRIVTTVSAITLSISIIASVLQLRVDQETIDTTIPLIIILQAPVIWLVLSLRNRIQKSLDPAD